jgi:hypothetical protein
MLPYPLPSSNIIFLEAPASLLSNLNINSIFPYPLPSSVIAFLEAPAGLLSNTDLNSTFITINMANILRDNKDKWGDELNNYKYLYATSYIVKLNRIYIALRYKK